MAERLIRSVAAEFCVPVSVSYSNWLRRQKQEDEITAQRGSPHEESTLLLCPCFWEYQDLKAEQDIGNTFQTRVTTTLSFAFSGLGSEASQRQHSSCRTVANLDQQPITNLLGCWIIRGELPGFPRCTSTGIEQLSRTARTEGKTGIFYRQWDSVQEFFAAWEKKMRNGVCRLLP